MISIAICDDDAIERKQVYRETEEYLKKVGEPYKIREFDNGEALWYEVDNGVWFDLYLLDIEMPGMDGFRLTSEIKRKISASPVIFISAYEKYVYDSFHVRAFRFIPKSGLRERLPEALSSAVKQIKILEGKLYIAKNQQGVEKIPQKNIMYIWHKEKYAYIEKINGEHTKVRKTLKEVYKELDRDAFEWIDRGCICNLAHVTCIKDDCVSLINGESQKISRERRQTVKKRLREYLVRLEGAR